ncbi:MAG: hypothetical protein JO293_07155 [Candidatus Eremiobacteraeota bacterium]|nr:hypothetical protein [Candidatus Eremiobacteraeota bacterium]
MAWVTRHGGSSWEVSMSLELVNTFGTLLTACIIAATAIVAIVQLRHLRAGNQISAMLSIGEELSAPAVANAQALIRGELKDALNDESFLAYNDAFDQDLPLPKVPPEYEELRRATIVIGNAYEELGILVKNGIVDSHLFLDRYSWVILGAWNRLLPVTSRARAVTGKNAIWENFEYLAVLSEDWMVAHPSLYPKGMRRMPMPAAATLSTAV